MPTLEPVLRVWTAKEQALGQENWFQSGPNILLKESLPSWAGWGYHDQGQKFTLVKNIFQFQGFLQLSVFLPEAYSNIRTTVYIFLSQQIWLYFQKTYDKLIGPNQTPLLFFVTYYFMFHSFHHRKCDVWKCEKQKHVYVNLWPRLCIRCVYIM